MVAFKRNEFTVAIATLALLVYFLTLSVISQVASPSITDKTVRNVGSIKTIGVGIYWDENCTIEVSSIDWGIMDPGSSKNVTVYVRNEGNSAAILAMYTSNWNHSNASDYINLSWNYEGQVIDVSEALEVAFTLTISTEIQGITSFSFDIVIVGSG